MTSALSVARERGFQWVACASTGNTSAAMAAYAARAGLHSLVLIPEVNDGVWIEFEAGDISRPIWTGFWWASDELDDVSKTKARALVTTEGHRLVLDDEGKEIQLLHSKGAEMKMTEDDITLTIGGTEIKLTKNDLTLKSGLGQIKLSAAGVVQKPTCWLVGVQLEGSPVFNLGSWPIPVALGFYRA